MMKNTLKMIGIITILIDFSIRVRLILIKILKEGIRTIIMQIGKKDD
jgi:hypothetical protein